MGSGIERIHPVRFLAGCSKRRLKQFLLSILCAVHWGQFDYVALFVLVCLLLAASDGLEKLISEMPTVI